MKSSQKTQYRKSILASNLHYNQIIRQKAIFTKKYYAFLMPNIDQSLQKQISFDYLFAAECQSLRKQIEITVVAILIVEL